jgi:hypothetical protein
VELQTEVLRKDRIGLPNPTEHLALPDFDSPTSSPKDFLSKFLNLFLLRADLSIAV